jgi:hypothetical protein
MSASLNTLPAGLARVIARAAAPHERRHPCFVPVAGGEALALERERRWIQTATPGDSAAFARLLEARSLTMADFRLGLVDVEIVAGKGLPGWAPALERPGRTARHSTRSLLGVTRKKRPSPEFSVASIPWHAKRYASAPTPW